MSKRTAALVAATGLCAILACHPRADTTAGAREGRVVEVTTRAPEPLPLELSAEVRAELDRAQPAVATLQRGDVAAATATAERMLADDPDNPYLRAVRAIGAYPRAFAPIHRYLWGILDDPRAIVGLASEDARPALAEAERVLAGIDGDLAVVERTRGMQLDLCVACLSADWDGDGAIDDRDRAQWEIEDGTAATAPTFRFDDGDVAWLRGMIAFQRAAVAIAVAYDMRELPMLAATRLGMTPTVRLRLLDAARVRSAGDHLRAAAEHSLRARALYLEERDDAWEWVASPTQGHHFLPIRFTEAGYATWAEVLNEIVALADGRTGLDVGELASLGKEDVAVESAASIDLAAFFASPTDIVIDTALLAEARASRTEAAYRAFFATLVGGHVTEDLTPTPLVRLADREAEEVQLGVESWRAKRRRMLTYN
jgi:hypothetical protein